jgi:inosose dehydratase
VELAGHTYPYRALPLEAALDALSGLGFSSVEIWLGHARDGPEPVARALADRSLRAAAVGGGGFYSRGQHELARALSLVEAVEAPILVAADVSRVALDRAVATSPPHVTICLENHWDQWLSTPKTVAEALAVEDALAACLDTGHAIDAGVRPERFVDALGKRIRHVHLKEARFPGPAERLLGRRVRRRLGLRPQPVFPGRGSLDIGQLRRSLEGAGYAGAVSLEYEGPEATDALAELLAIWRQAASRSPGLAETG